MLRIGFVLPSSEYLHDPFRGDPHTHFQILTILEDYFDGQVGVSLIDLRGIKKEFAIRHIPECDVYLYSVYTLDYNEQISIVKNLKESYPQAKHIAGGSHAIEFQEECLKTFDSIIVGEGEDLIVLAVKDIMNLSLKKKYLQESMVDLDLFPVPSRKYLPRSSVLKKGLICLKDKRDYDEFLGTTAIFSRGCPYKCHFCHMPRTKEYGLGIRFRKPELIESEIEYLKREYQIKVLNLFDEICLPLSRDKAIPHLEAIGRTGITWKAQCRVDSVTPEMAQLIRSAGCVVMGVGVESTSQTALDMINKKINVAQAMKSIQCLKKHGIEVRLYMMMGLPGEPEDITERNWAFIKEVNPDLVYLSLLTVRPGTAMFNSPEQFGFKRINKDWDKTMHLYNRYDNEMPALTFEYREQAPWGKSLSNDQIVKNYLDLQGRLKENGLCAR